MEALNSHKTALINSTIALQGEIIARRSKVSALSALLKQVKHLETENVFLKEACHELMHKTLPPLAVPLAKSSAVFSQPLPPIFFDFPKSRSASRLLATKKNKLSLHCR